MRRLFLIAAIILCVIAAVWYMKRPAPEPAPVLPPPLPVVPAAPPVVEKVPVPVPPVPKKVPPKIPQKPAPSKPVTPVPQVVVPVPPPVVPIPPPVQEPKEWKGNNDTSIKHSGQIVVLNDHQWTRFWSEHHPDEVSPDVDFSQNMVVGVFQGRRPADAFRVDIVGVRTEAGALVVDYIEHAPPPGTFQVGVEVYPYDIKVIPKSALHVKFNPMRAQYEPSPYQRPAASTAPAPVLK